MQKLILIGAAVILAILFLPSLMSGGGEGVKDKSNSAGDAIVDTVKDPEAVGDAAGKVVDPVVEVATPWWDALYAQPWFWTAVIAVAAAFGAKKLWDDMGGTARLITVAVAVFAFMFTVIAIFK